MEVLFRAEVDNTQLLTIEDTKLLEYIDGKYYAIGYLNSENKIEIKNDKYIYAFKIKEKTKSINFEDMLDSQGNKIFASLSEDGKGGDVVKHEQVLGGILKSSGPEECIIKYCNRDHIIAPFFINAKYKNQKTYMTKEHLLIIGIQQ